MFIRRTLNLTWSFYACFLLVIAACSETEPSAFDSLEISEEEVSSDGLHGVQLSAGAHTPMVLIIPGSGPTDRDGNSPNGLNTDAYKLLARDLLERGVSSVRVDKRGLFSSAHAGDANAVTVEQYASDYSGWVETLLGDGTRSCIFLLGHSEGGVMAIATAIKSDDVCGLILIATPGRPLDEILVDQLQANPANSPILEDAYSAIASLKKGEKVDTSGLHPALANLFHANVQGFLISMMNHDPVDLLRETNLRSIVVQGGTDLQVSEKDASLLASVENAELVLIPDMNHVLKDASDIRTENVMTYSNPDLPLSEGLVDAIAKFTLK